MTCDQEAQTPAEEDKPGVLEQERQRRGAHKEAGTTDPVLASAAALAEGLKGGRP